MRVIFKFYLKTEEKLIEKTLLNLMKRVEKEHIANIINLEKRKRKYL